MAFKDIILPTVEEMLALIRRKPGINMRQMHDLNYRLVFGKLDYLLGEELIFKDNDRYYPND